MGLPKKGNMKENQVLYKHEDMYILGNDRPNSRTKKLPVGTYLMGASMELGLFLKQVPDFELPEKLYGDIKQKAGRILDTYEDRPRTTGVLLSGEKGSGKTLLTKTISRLAQERGLPTILVNNDFSGDSFNLFLQEIGECVLLFDEFEKIYDKDSQQALLTLLDGIFTTKKLILLTTNSYVGINEHFHNRPGRIFYNLEFNGLGHDFIMEYGAEKLANKQHISNLGVVASMVNPMSFDILQAIIEESNRYNESPVKALEMLNVKMNQSFAEPFILKVENKEGAKNPFVKLDSDDDDDKTLRVNPFRPFHFSYYTSAKKTKKNPSGLQYNEAYITTENLKVFDGLKGVYVYENDDFTITLKRKPFDTRTGFSKFEHLAGDTGTATVDGPNPEAPVQVAPAPAPIKVKKRNPVLVKLDNNF